MLLAIDKVLLCFFSKRLMIRRLNSQYRFLTGLPGTRSAELMTEVERERTYITRVLKYRSANPETLYTLWGHIECLDDEIKALFQDYVHT